MKAPYFVTHLLKDLRLEWRSKDAINSMLFFALLVVVLFSLAFDPTRESSRQIAGGILCAILFREDVMRVYRICRPRLCPVCIAVA